MFSGETKNSFDCVIVGGGLAGGLLFYALKMVRPHVNVVLLEKGHVLGGNHTWSFHAADIPTSAQWIHGLISHKWESYEVVFPSYRRHLKSAYCSIRSEDFHHKITQKYSNSIFFGCRVKDLFADRVLCEDGRSFSAKAVIDARGWSPLLSDLKYGYQKFVGLDVKLQKPHGLSHVILKDVRVPQTDGYRFFYVLPWGPSELLVEDTYYSNSPELNVEVIRAQIEEYLLSSGWQIEEVQRQEVGCLPLALFADDKIEESGGVLKLGASSGVYQPVTGYTFPQTVSCVESLVNAPFEEWSDVLSKQQKSYHRQASFLRALNRMMFLAAKPEQRYVILERFYRLSEGLIARFYQGKLSWQDQFRILCGKPPVSIWQALKVLIK